METVFLQGKGAGREGVPAPANSRSTGLHGSAVPPISSPIQKRPPNRVRNA